MCRTVVGRTERGNNTVSLSRSVGVEQLSWCIHDHGGNLAMVRTKDSCSQKPRWISIVQFERRGCTQSAFGIVTGIAFCGQTRALAAVINKLTSFSRWASSCHCHEEESRGGKRVICPLKGCRARELSDKLASVASSLAEQRSSLPDYGSVPRHDVALALAMAMSDLHSKFLPGSRVAPT